MRRTFAVTLLALAACSSVIVTPGPSDEGAYLDEGATAEEVDGLLVQCGNELDANYYWMVQDEGPSKMYIMPVVCVGPLTTTGFDLEDAEPTDGRFGFPAWDAEIKDLCAEACLAEHEPATGQTPTCELDAFSPNLAWGEWQPGEGTNCDSTIAPRLVPGRDFTGALP